MSDSKHRQSRVRVPGPLAGFAGQKPPAPGWFDSMLAQQPQRQFCEVRGAKIETLVWGAEGAPGVLLLHGNGAHADWWSFIAPFLAADYRVTAISWSGMGGSDWRQQYSTQMYIEEAFACSHASGLFDGPHKPVFVGHSFGGFPTMAAAAERGADLCGIVLVDTPLWSPEMRAGRPSPRDPAREFKPSKVYPSMSEALARFRLSPDQPCENAFIVDHIARTSLRETTGAQGVGYTWRFDPFLWKNYEERPAQDDLAAVKCPVSMIWGAQSRLMPPAVIDHMRRLAPPGSPAVEIPLAGHHVMLDQPIATAVALRALLGVR